MPLLHCAWHVSTIEFRIHGEDSINENHPPEACGVIFRTLKVIPQKGTSITVPGWFLSALQSCHDVSSWIGTHSVVTAWNKPTSVSSIFMVYMALRSSMTNNSPLKMRYYTQQLYGSWDCIFALTVFRPLIQKIFSCMQLYFSGEGICESWNFQELSVDF